MDALGCASSTAVLSANLLPYESDDMFEACWALTTRLELLSKRILLDVAPGREDVRPLQRMDHRP